MAADSGNDYLGGTQAGAGERNTPERCLREQERKLRGIRGRVNCKSGISLTGVTTTCSVKIFTTRFARDTEAQRRKCFTNLNEGEYPLVKIRETTLEGRIEGDESGIPADFFSFFKYFSLLFANEIALFPSLGVLCALCGNLIVLMG